MTLQRPDDSNLMKNKGFMQKLTIKQRKFIKAYLVTGNATQAAKDAGYKCKNDPAYAEMGHQNLRKLEAAMCQVLVEAGLDNAALAKKALEGLDAIVVKPFAHGGKVIDEKVYIDYPTRAKYLEITAKMKGLLKEKAEKKVEGTVAVKIVKFSEESKGGYRRDSAPK